MGNDGFYLTLYAELIPQTLSEIIPVFYLLSAFFSIAMHQPVDHDVNDVGSENGTHDEIEIPDNVGIVFHQVKDPR